MKGSIISLRRAARSGKFRLGIRISEYAVERRIAAAGMKYAGDADEAIDFHIDAQQEPVEIYLDQGVLQSAVTRTSVAAYKAGAQINITREEKVCFFTLSVSSQALTKNSTMNSNQARRFGQHRVLSLHYAWHAVRVIPRKPGHP